MSARVQIQSPVTDAGIMPRTARSSNSEGKRARGLRNHVRLLAPSVDQATQVGAPVRNHHHWSIAGHRHVTAFASPTLEAAHSELL